MGTTFPHSFQGKTNGDIPFIKVSDFPLADRGILSTANNWVSATAVRHLGGRILPRGCVLYPRVGAALLLNQRRLTGRPCVVDDNVRGFEPYSGDPRYWRYLMTLLDMGKITNPGPVPSVSETQVAAVRVPLPPPDEQRRIADFLDAETTRITALMDARSSQLRCLEQLWDARLANKVEELIAIHGLIPLRRVVTSLEQGWSPQCEDTESTSSEWAVLKTSAVSTGRFMPLEHKRLPNDLEPDLRYQIADGDILMTRGSGSPAHVGVATVAKTGGRRLLLSDLLYRVRLDQAWSPEFVTLLLGSLPVRGFASLLFRGQSGQTIKLRAEDVKSIDIPNVPVTLQSGIASELLNTQLSIEEAKKVIRQSYVLLGERRQALITAAVTGQFDVSTASGRNVTDGVPTS